MRQQKIPTEEFRQELMEILRDGAERSDEQVRELIDDLILERGRFLSLSLAERNVLRRELFSSVRELDVLQALIEDDTVTEIMVNGPDRIFVERQGLVERVPVRFASRQRLEDVIQQVAGACNRIVNEHTPLADARLADGSRVHIAISPVALDGPILTIRRFPKDPITMERLIRTGSITREAAEFLEELVRCHYTILVGGGTGTGKTTFLNVLCNAIPKGERILTIEDTAELQIRGVDNLVRLETRQSTVEQSVEIDQRELVRAALRMRPNRIILGEVRGAEAGDFLICLNTGHSGSLGSAHANSVREMISRLEMMVLMGMELPIPVIRRQIASGIEILVHLKRDSSGRRVVEEIAEITGMEGEHVAIRTLFQREQGELRKKEELLRKEKRENEKNRVGEWI